MKNNCKPVKCRVCQAESFVPLYQGPIRMGKYGEWSEDDRVVYCCEHCGTGYLPGSGFEYESEEYRRQVDAGTSVEDYWGAHDAEQADRLHLMGSGQLRDKTIADIGCGAGSFLDLVSGMAQKTIGIEPCTEYHGHLKKNHSIYQYTENALSDWQNQVDMATSFAVIEHVEDPLLFLVQVRKLLKTGGRLLISTPNRDDWLLKFLPDAYGRFFYRQAHRWYFNAASLAVLAENAGFKVVEHVYRQQFDVSNALHWIRDEKPTGIGKSDILSTLNGEYKRQLEEKGISNFLYTWLEV